RARILENDDLLPIAPAHQKLRVADLPLRFHSPNELGAICRVPVERCNAWQGVQFLSAAIAQDGDERRVHRPQPSVPAALIYPLDDGLEQATVFGFARAQGFLREPARNGDTGELRGVVDDAQLPLTWEARRRVVDVKRPKESAV